VVFCSCVVCFCCVRFSFFSTNAKRLAGKNISEMHLGNDLFCVEWDVKLIIQSTKLLIFYILLISTYISEVLLTI